MTGREKKMVYALAGIGVLGLVGIGYFAVIQPYQEARADLERLESDLADRETALTRAFKDKKKADEAKKRSLPADPNIARAEYDSALRRLLAKAGAPLGTTVAPKETADTKAGPYLNDKKKPAFTRLGFEIVMKKADLGSVMRFLTAFHELGLLHQITRVHLQRKDESGSRKDRSDLEVKITAEAVILDGAENRKTLLPVPLGFALVGGNAGYQALMQTAEAGRGIAPPKANPVLSPGKRDYASVVAKDYFHGPLPEIIVKKPDPPKPFEPPPPPPVTPISPFIKLTDTTRNPDGSYVSTIYDQMNQQEYTVKMTPKGERFEVEVRKLYTLANKKRLLDSWADLVIAEDNTDTNRKFKVVGPSGLDLVLVEMVAAGEKPAKVGDKPVEKPRFGAPVVAKPKLGAPTDVSAVAGGLALVPPAAPPVEKVFVWKLGQTLKNLSEIPPENAAEVLKTAAESAMPRLAAAAGN